MNARGLRLLEQYTRQGAEEAFAALVREYLDLVYSAALRAARSPQLAEEVAQSVFTDLARQAHKMKPDTLLSAWLYRVTRRTAIDVVRRETRRQRREQVAVEQAGQHSPASSEWTHVEPLLDGAMDALPEADRNAVLLRFFEGKDLKAVGGVLGVSEEAARKRVARAVERLRQFFSKRGVEITSAGGAALLSAKAVEAAPAGLAAALSSSGAVLSAAATLQFTKAITMTTLQKLALSAAVAAALGTAVYEQHRLSQMRQQIQALQRQQGPLATQVNDLILERDRLAASFKDAEAQHGADLADLPKLRSEVARLRNQARTVAQTKPAPDGPVSETPAAKAALLRQRLEQTSGPNVIYTSAPGTNSSTIWIEGSANVIHPVWYVKGDTIAGMIEVGPGFPAEPGQAVTPGMVDVQATNVFIRVRSLRSVEKDGKLYSDHMDDVMKAP